jgi:hypothetical protein
MRPSSVGFGRVDGSSIFALIKKPAQNDDERSENGEEDDSGKRSVR